jgi:adenosylhomocysteine nucleosidase
MEKNPYGEYFQEVINQRNVVFQHGGWGKISAAASTEMAVNRWNPEVIINIGTCGGFAGEIERGAILMPDRTLSYDIIEQMGDAQEAIEAYSTLLDHSWLKQPYPLPVQGGILVSGDRDIVPESIPDLILRYHSRAADWESASIAWVAAKKHQRRCLILRGVTDLVSPQGGEAYGGMDFFEQASQRIMDQLCGSLPGWLTCAGL